MAFAATKVVTDETIVTKLATTLTDKVPEAIAEMGITAEINKSFQKNTYVVLKVNISNFNKINLLKATKGNEYSEKFQNLLNSLEELELSEALVTIDNKVGNKIVDSLITKLTEVIPLKVKDAGLEVTCKVCKSEDQADYFYNFIENNC